MLRYLLLLIIVLSITFVGLLGNNVIQITIVLPEKLVPYFDWLMAFPDWNPDLEQPSSESPERTIDYYY